MTRAERFTRWAVGIAAVYGTIALGSLYLQPASGDPAFFYGFIGCALVMQAAYALVAWRPRRYAALLLVGIAGKLSFVIPCAILFAQGRLASNLALGAAIDLLVAGLFATCWCLLRRADRRPAAG